MRSSPGPLAAPRAFSVPGAVLRAGSRSAASAGVVSAAASGRRRFGRGVVLSGRCGIFGRVRGFAQTCYMIRGGSDFGGFAQTCYMFRGGSDFGGFAQTCYMIRGGSDFGGFAQTCYMFRGGSDFVGFAQT